MGDVTNLGLSLETHHPGVLMPNCYPGILCLPVPSPHIKAPQRKADIEQTPHYLFKHLTVSHSRSGPREPSHPLKFSGKT